VFEAWNDEFSAPLRRVLDPPTPVLVDLTVAFVPEPGYRRDAVSMRTKTAGLDRGLRLIWEKSHAMKKG
jgi:hypothetical protein